MNIEWICKKDCQHLINRSCRYKHDIAESIITTEKAPCIYYAKRIPTAATFPINQLNSQIF